MVLLGRDNAFWTAVHVVDEGTVVATDGHRAIERIQGVTPGLYRAWAVAYDGRPVDEALAFLRSISKTETTEELPGGRRYDGFDGFRDWKADAEERGWAVSKGTASWLARDQQGELVGVYYRQPAGDPASGFLGDDSESFGRWFDFQQGKLVEDMGGGMPAAAAGAVTTADTGNFDVPLGAKHKPNKKTKKDGDSDEQAYYFPKKEDIDRDQVQVLQGLGDGFLVTHPESGLLSVVKKGQWYPRIEADTQTGKIYLVKDGLDEDVVALNTDPETIIDVANKYL